MTNEVPDFEKMKFEKLNAIGFYSKHHKELFEVIDFLILAGRKAQVKVDLDLALSHTSTDGDCSLSLSNVEGYRTAVDQIAKAIESQVIE